ncbi:MAG: alpha/beta hydrolase-fold protein [Bacteroidota bacterium]|nr:alpha/beta hydrolase-fold protein [Bacteroidota bacterium]
MSSLTKIIFFIIIFYSSLIAQTFTSFVQKLERLPIHQREVSAVQFLRSINTTPFIEQDSLLHFIWYGNASSVLINGNLQHWNLPDTLKQISCGEKSFFFKSFFAPTNARLDYQLIVDGTYQLDSLNPRITPSGFGPHSEVRMSKFVSSKYIAIRDSIERGKIDTVSLYAFIPSPLKQYLMAGRMITVYRPAGYDTLSELSSVYIHDGNDAIAFAHVPTILDNLIADKKIPPVIAVFIPSVNRGAEYVGDFRDRYVKLLCDELVPAIDKKYKTNRSSSHRAMMGISNGGHISLYTVLKRLDVFHLVGGQSSTITPWLTELTRQRAKEHALSPTVKIYFDVGRFDIKQDDVDFLELNRSYSNLLSSFHIPHYYKEVNDGHEWANWRERMPEMLIYFFGK